MHSALETATISWRNATTPVSSQFDDIYFSAENGLAESQFVYLDNNHLQQRFQQLQANHFIIGETGFGTGLNFLLTWQLWQASAPKDKKLYYISTERFPLTPNDLLDSLTCWPELKTLSERLIQYYPITLSGVHTVELDANITLILLFNDATVGLQSLIENQHPLIACTKNRAVDAWFLDGFAPDKNPDMWSDALFFAIAKLSKHQTTFSSFTAAGTVRRGLSAVGFNVKKVKGFGKKREMICGHYVGLPTLARDITPITRERPYDDFWPIYRSPENLKKNVLVIGAGIAGASTALALAEAGIKVTLIEQAADAFAGASGNPQAMLFPKFSFESGIFAEFNLASYLYALRFYQNMGDDVFFNSGMLQTLQAESLENAKKIQQRFSEFDELVQLIDASTASKIANTQIDDVCLYFKNSGWLRPKSLQAHLLAHNNIDFIAHTTIQYIEKNNDQWQAVDTNGNHYYGTDIVLCNAQSALHLLPEHALQTKTIRGQITQFNRYNFPSINTIVCHEGYIAPLDPLQPEQYSCGASYDSHQNETALSKQSQQQNIAQLEQALPDFYFGNKTIPLQGRVEFRCTATDYLPLVGPIPKQQDFIKNYANYAKNSKAHIPILGDYYEGLFVNIAHGSRGFSTAPICAALIRSYIAEQPWPLDYASIKAVHPARFIIKDIIRKKASPI